MHKLPAIIILWYEYSLWSENLFECNGNCNIL